MNRAVLLLGALAPVLLMARPPVPAALPPVVHADTETVTNVCWRLRGAYDDAFRPMLESWRFPVRDGVVTGVTVLARGEVRPDVGTLYFPVSPVDGVSLLPAVRWGLLSRAPEAGAQPNRGEFPTGVENSQDGGLALGCAPAPGARERASVFWHALSPSNSLLLTWENALVGRDPNCPTNLQAELYADGRFAWRTDGGSRLYFPVLEFDWDGDGLENSVDPDPLVAGPDAHGTNAEWYMDGWIHLHRQPVWMESRKCSTGRFAL